MEEEEDEERRQGDWALVDHCIDLEMVAPGSLVFAFAVAALVEVVDQVGSSDSGLAQHKDVSAMQQLVLETAEKPP